MVYEVWDSESANIVGAFDTQKEALDALGRSLSDYGSSYISVLVLGVEDDAGDSVMIATGPDLVNLVENHLRRSLDFADLGAPSAERSSASEAELPRR